MNQQQNFSMSLTTTLSKIQSPAGINYLNIGLMAVSAFFAYLLPFELFLFSYAFLGPLHYLTELSWLEKKNFFVKSKKEAWLFVFLAIAAALGSIVPETNLNQFIGHAMLAGFLFAVLMLFVEKFIYKVLAVAFIIFIMYGNKLNMFPDAWFIIFGILLPTVVHVFLFTGAFILHGALKSRSVSGILSLTVFVLCALLFLFYQPALFYDNVSTTVRETYTSFQLVNIAIYKFFVDAQAAIDATHFYTGTVFVSIMRFIAFAYTYHYLNWFSKTSVIKWNQISKQRMTAIIALWLVSVGLFLFDYKIGLYSLLTLSLIHVFCEFPLNHLTFIGIFKEVKSMVVRK